MFERFTERARHVVVFAQDEARLLRHNYLGTEHLLLGLLREEEGVAAIVLAELGVTTGAVRTEVARIVGQGDERSSGQIPFTPRSKKVLELALSEALSLGHNYIGTEHLLLGLVRENQGRATGILLSFDADAEKIRTAILERLSDPRRRRAPAEAPPTDLTFRHLVEAASRALQDAKKIAVELQYFERAAVLDDVEAKLGRVMTGPWTPGPDDDGVEDFIFEARVERVAEEEGIDADDALKIVRGEEREQREGEHERPTARADELCEWVRREGGGLGFELTKDDAGGILKRVENPRWKGKRAVDWIAERLYGPVGVSMQERRAFAQRLLDHVRPDGDGEP
jgi:hypothetical protein